MSSDRYVLLGLAPPRAAWFEAVAQWTTSAALAAEFIKCVSAEEVRVRLASGRRHSALLIDASTPALDRDLVDLAASAATPVIVVRDTRSPAFSLREVGAASELASGFTQTDLIDCLANHAQLIGRGADLPPALDQEIPGSHWMGQLFTVCGPGGTGASTAAIALAQGLASDPRYGRRVLLADLARRADQAMLHDALELGPGVQEMVDAHRIRRPDVEEVRRTTFDVPSRGYRLLLGLRQPEAWAALRPRAIDAAIDGLRRSFQVVVADVTGDFEGESEGGSIEVEERNHMARRAALSSSVVVAVGAPGLKGTHSLGGTIRSLVRIGVPPSRILAVITRSPRNPRARAESARALAATLSGSNIELAMATPVHLPERKVEEILRDGSPLPSPVVDPLARAVLSVAERMADAEPATTGPTRIATGSLGTWAEGTGPTFRAE